MIYLYLSGKFISFMKSWIYSIAFSVLLVSLSGCRNSSEPTIGEEPELEIPSVKIGNQIWMAENLEVSTYQNGDPITLMEPNEYWRQTTDGAWCYYNNDSANYYHFGKLYNWHAINDPRGICPKGWRVPTKQDWDELIRFAGGDTLAGGNLKNPRIWDRIHENAINKFGFSAIPGGYRLTDGKFMNQGIISVYWTADKADQNNAWDIFLISKSPIAGISQTGTEHGFSCRCIKEK
jgi:uncharacterized protein (TIGR02145 family)